jgi:hypothetical protein
MLEADLQRAVIKHAQRLGWKVAHFRPGKQGQRYVTAVAGDGAGFPDLTMVRGGRLLFVELKQDRRYPKPEQKAWLEALARCAEVHIWRPKDWPDEINAVLQDKVLSP